MKKFIIALIAILFLLTGGLYGAGVLYFSDHFLPGTVINGEDFSFKTIKDVENRLQNKATVYVLEIDERDQGREKLSADEIGLQYQAENRLEEELNKQKKWQWFLSFTNHIILGNTECMQCDDDLLKNAISKLSCMQAENIISPKDASYEDDGEKYIAVQEVDGNELDFDKTAEAIKTAVLLGENKIDLEEKNCYKEPKVRVSSPDFQRNLEQRNALTQVLLTYDFGSQSERVDRSIVNDWLVLDENQDLVVSREAASEYVAKLAEKYNAMGTDKQFRTYDGRQITISGGNYGWIIDQEAETEALISDIENGTIDVREPIYEKRGGSRKNNSAGDTYLEIDLTSQRMVMYKDKNLILDTGIVSGTDTPTGFFAAGTKETSVYLEDEMETANYWIPFTDDLGVHDAVWREEFGGDLYLMFGSTSGIDVSLEAAQTVYENLDEGDPIIIY